jgi:hypothetical protein
LLAGSVPCPGPIAPSPPQVWNKKRATSANRALAAAGSRLSANPHFVGCLLDLTSTLCTLESNVACRRSGRVDLQCNNIRSLGLFPTICPSATWALAESVDLNAAQRVTSSDKCLGLGGGRSQIVRGPSESGFLRDEVGCERSFVRTRYGRGPTGRQPLIPHQVGAENYEGASQCVGGQRGSFDP